MKNRYNEIQQRENEDQTLIEKELELPWGSTSTTPTSEFGDN